MPVETDKIWALLFGNGESLAMKTRFISPPVRTTRRDGVFGALRLAAAKK